MGHAVQLRLSDAPNPNPIQCNPVRRDLHDGCGHKAAPARAAAEQTAAAAGRDLCCVGGCVPLRLPTPGDRFGAGVVSSLHHRQRRRRRWCQLVFCCLVGWPQPVERPRFFLFLFNQIRQHVEIWDQCHCQGRMADQKKKCHCQGNYKR